MLQCTTLETDRSDLPKRLFPTIKNNFKKTLYFFCNYDNVSFQRNILVLPMARQSPTATSYD